MCKVEGEKTNFQHVKYYIRDPVVCAYEIFISQFTLNHITGVIYTNISVTKLSYKFPYEP